MALAKKQLLGAIGIIALMCASFFTYLYFENTEERDLVDSANSNEQERASENSTDEQEDVGEKNPEDNVQGNTSIPADTAITPGTNPEGQLVTHIFNAAGIPSPKAAEFTVNGKEIWATSLMNANNGVFILDVATGILRDTIQLPGGGGVEIIFSDDGTKAYVSQMETARVFEIDTKTRAILRTFDTKSSWTKILAFSPDEKKLYASNWVGDNVSEFDLQTGRLLRNIPVVDTPRGLYLTEDGQTMYVAGFGNGELQKINLSTGTGRIIHNSNGAMRHIVGDEKKGVLYISDMAKGVIWELDVDTDRVRKFADTDTNPNTMALSPDNNILIVSNRGVNYSATNYSIPGPEWGSVLLFDTNSGEMLDAVVGGNQPTALAISSDGEKFVFSDFLDARLQVFDMPSYEALKTGNGGRSDAYKMELRK